MTFGVVPGARADLARDAPAAPAAPCPVTKHTAAASITATAATVALLQLARPLAPITAFLPAAERAEANTGKWDRAGAALMHGTASNT